ncbi:condensation domain-containing protein, partial [Streptomyces sp. CBMA123]|uniref:condensation domain-containing protein n=1 Tax=Streptomyces sp. CBMA123 TaxID=1896313 RepID=UPI001661ABD6
AATGRALARTADVPGVTLGTVTDGRSARALEPVVGYFVNPLAVPLPGARDLTDAALLRHTADAVVSALEHGRTPFDELVRLLKPPRGRHPWFQAWAVLQKRPPRGEFAPGLRLEPVRVPPPRTAHELLVEAVPRGDGGWDLITSRRADVLGEARAEEFTDRLHRALGEFATAAPVAPAASAGPAGPAGPGTRSAAPSPERSYDDRTTRRAGALSDG